MPKQVFNINIVVTTDGPIPGRDNILNISAKYDNFEFSRNVQPQGDLHWKRKAELLEPLLTNARPLPEVMGEFREWLKKFPGRLVAVTTALDFMHLMNAFLFTGRDFPFGAGPQGAGLIDVNTYVAAANNADTVHSIMGDAPTDLLAKRYAAYEAAKSKLGSGFSLSW